MQQINGQYIYIYTILQLINAYHEMLIYIYIYTYFIVVFLDDGPVDIMN